MQNTDIQVFVRVKPQTSSSRAVEADQSKVSVTYNIVKSQGAKKENYLSTCALSCHGVIGANRSTVQACQDIHLERDYIQKCLEQKQSALICCYGQSCSGKSHTIFGSHQHKGVLDCTVEYLLSRGYHISLCSFEIYNDKLIDLIPAMGASKGNRKPIRDLEEFSHVCTHIQIHRSTGSTGLNASSSRSHGIIRIYIEPFDSGILGEQASSITFMDLAGIEGCKKSKTSGQAMQEGIQINKSLMTLRTCIRCISSSDDGKKQYIPWRESRLTSAMKPYLHRGSNVCFILCISSDASNAYETVSTLRFGAMLMDATLEEKAVKSILPKMHACHGKLCVNDLQVSPLTPSYEYIYEVSLVVSLGGLSIVLFILYLMYWVRNQHV